MSEQIRVEFDDYRDNRNAQLEAEGASSKFYVDNSHWPTWQASRQSLVVKLPELFNATFCDAYEADAMKEALGDAGVRCE